MVRSQTVSSTSSRSSSASRGRPAGERDLDDPLVHPVQGDGEVARRRAGRRGPAGPLGLDRGRGLGDEVLHDRRPQRLHLGAGRQQLGRGGGERAVVAEGVPHGDQRRAPRGPGAGGAGQRGRPARPAPRRPPGRAARGRPPPWRRSRSRTSSARCRRPRARSSTEMSASGRSSSSRSAVASSARSRSSPEGRRARRPRPAPGSSWRWLTRADATSRVEPLDTPSSGDLPRQGRRQTVVRRRPGPSVSAISYTAASTSRSCGR